MLRLVDSWRAGRGKEVPGRAPKVVLVHHGTHLREFTTLNQGIRNHSPKQI